METLKEFLKFDNVKTLKKIQVGLMFSALCGFFVFYIMLSSTSRSVIFASDYALLFSAFSIMFIGVAQIRIENLEINY